MTITGLYAGILALIYLVLTVRVIALRYKSQTAFGNGDEILMHRVRVHGNFIEYVPLALILMGILDWQQTSVMLLHILGITLIVGRILHALALTCNILPFRMLGMVATMGVIFVEAVLTIAHYVL